MPKQQENMAVERGRVAFDNLLGDVAEAQETARDHEQRHNEPDLVARTPESVA
ncbi:MAG: hypothetical protein WCF38_04080 [Pseudolabrys sp.]